MKDFDKHETSTAMLFTKKSTSKYKPRIPSLVTFFSKNILWLRKTRHLGLTLDEKNVLGGLAAILQGRGSIHTEQ